MVKELKGYTIQENGIYFGAAFTLTELENVLKYVVEKFPGTINEMAHVL